MPSRLLSLLGILPGVSRLWVAATLHLDAVDAAESCARSGWILYPISPLQASAQHENMDWPASTT